MHAPHGGHEHHAPQTLSAAAKSQRRLTMVLGLTTAYMLAEVAGGLLTNSLALLADAGHMFTDVLGLAMALVAIRFAQRPATPAKTYGFYRAEILAALVNGVVLFGIAGYILYEAWLRFREPQQIDSLPMLTVALGGLAVNLFGAGLLHSGAGESLNIRGAFLEVLSDLLGSVGVIGAAAIIYFTGWQQADPLVSVLIGLFILPRTWSLLKSALDVLLEATPSHIDLHQVEDSMRQTPGVESVHDLHIWTITSGFVAMSGHVLAKERPSGDVLHDLRLRLRQQFGIEHVTLQVEQPDHADDGACCSVDARCLVAGAGVPALAAAAAGGPHNGQGHDRH
ncbi:MAG: cation diffusion facilitator family transporter [Chloroflexi bacterium]|nr:cation diffusion facilitator family transporter [Chloroflexota bacterium]